MQYTTVGLARKRAVVDVADVYWRDGSGLVKLNGGYRVTGSYPDQ